MTETARPSSTTTTTTHTTPSFLIKTFDIINTSDSSIVAWVDNGNAFVIKDVEAFSQSIIPDYFNHRKFSSFVRQLNFYGFRKIKTGKVVRWTTTGGGGRSNTAVSGSGRDAGAVGAGAGGTTTIGGGGGGSSATVAGGTMTTTTTTTSYVESKHWKFRHERFKQNRPDLLAGIRKSGGSSSGTAHADHYPYTTADYNDDTRRVFQNSDWNGTANDPTNTNSRTQFHSTTTGTATAAEVDALRTELKTLTDTTVHMQEEMTKLKTLVETWMIQQHQTPLIHQTQPHIVSSTLPHAAAAAAAVNGTRSTVRETVATAVTSAGPLIVSHPSAVPHPLVSSHYHWSVSSPPPPPLQLSPPWQSSTPLAITAPPHPTTMAAYAGMTHDAAAAAAAVVAMTTPRRWNDSETFPNDDIGMDSLDSPVALSAPNTPIATHYSLTRSTSQELFERSILTSLMSLEGGDRAVSASAAGDNTEYDEDDNGTVNSSSIFLDYCI